MPDIKLTRAVARRLVDLLVEVSTAGEHPDVIVAWDELTGALDVAQAETPSTVEIEVTGEEIELR